MNPLAVNPWHVLILLVIWASTIAGSFSYGVHVEADHKDAAAAREDKIGRDSAAIAASVAASAISNIRVVNTTIQSKVQHEIETHTVYRDCAHTPDGLQLVNDALTGTLHQSASPSVLSASDPLRGSIVRSNDQQAR